MTEPLPHLIPLPRRTWSEAAGRRLLYARSAGDTLVRQCEGCGSTLGLEASHREAAGRGGSWRPSNLLDLCWGCHREHAHRYPLIARALGWHLDTGADPLTSPVWLIRPLPGFWLLRDDDSPLTPYHPEDHPHIDVVLPDDMALRTLLPAAARGALL